MSVTSCRTNSPMIHSPVSITLSRLLSWKWISPKMPILVWKNKNKNKYLFWWFQTKWWKLSFVFFYQFDWTWTVLDFLLAFVSSFGQINAVYCYAVVDNKGWLHFQMHWIQWTNQKNWRDPAGSNVRVDHKTKKIFKIIPLFKIIVTMVDDFYYRVFRIRFRAINWSCSL